MVVLDELAARDRVHGVGGSIVVHLEGGELMVGEVENDNVLA